MKRSLVQGLATLISNINIFNFFTGKIYTGSLKTVCVPGLNCYSCPGAIGSCPIGALQSVSGSVKYQISLYIIGIMMLFGTLMGRFICGWLCPFGWVQDIIFKIKSKKIQMPKIFNLVKYGVLVYFVLLFPVIFTNKIGIGTPGFCTYICPSGTLFASFPLLIANPSLRSAIGMLFNLKVAILILTLLGSVFVYRFFCKLLCPLGAFYSVFNKISFYQLQVDSETCIECGICERTCKMNIVPYKTPNHLECIRCGDCIEACPTAAIKRKKHNEKPIQIEI